jgi:hypothetical protein
MDTEALLKRRQELFKVIDQQMMMTDDQNDMLLFASSMYESSIKIFINQYGVATTKEMTDGVFRNIVLSLLDDQEE